MFMRIKVNLFIEMTVFVCLFFFIYSTLIFQCILGIHYIQTFICLWPFVYCWWPCETPEVEQLKLEMDPWLLVVSSGCKWWGWSTGLRQIQSGCYFCVLLMFNPIWNDDPAQVGAAHVFCPTGGSWVEHGGNTVETNGR